MCLYAALPPTGLPHPVIWGWDLAITLEQRTETTPNRMTVRCPPGAMFGSPFLTFHVSRITL
jgi:hypothetical protein